MNRKRGLIDIDNTLSDWVGWIGDKLGKKPLNPFAARVEDMYGVSEEEATKLVNDPGGYSSKRLRAIPNASQVLSELCLEHGYGLDYVSAAPVEWYENRRTWMIRNGFPLPETGFPGNTLTHLGSFEKKIDWILENGRGYVFAIDDQVKYLDSCRTVGITIRFLLSALHNIHDQDAPHLRIKSWHEVLPYLR